MAVRMVSISGSRMGPRLVCDQCRGVIETTRDASAEWRGSETGGDDGAEVFFTHNACTRAFRSARGGQGGWQWARLEDFNYWLAKNLAMRVEIHPGTPMRPYQIHGQLLDLGADDAAG